MRAIWDRVSRAKSAASVSTGDHVNGWNSVVALSTAIERRPPCCDIHRDFSVSACSWVTFGWRRLQVAGGDTGGERRRRCTSAAT